MVEVDPNLGRHDDFLLLGPYIFAQRNDSGQIHLYISYLRQPFNLAMIPTTDPHDVRKATFSTSLLKLSLSLSPCLISSYFDPPNTPCFPSLLSLSSLSHDTQRYFVTHINELQALVIVQHTSGRYNLYLSDITGVFFSLSLADIVISRQGIDLELVSTKLMHIYMYMYTMHMYIVYTCTL